MRHLLLLTALVGCAEVEHTLVRSADGVVAWRMTTVVAEAPAVLPAEWADLVRAHSSDLARAWMEPHEEGAAFVVQARVADEAQWRQLRLQLIAAARNVVGAVPAALIPPHWVPRPTTESRWTATVKPDAPSPVSGFLSMAFMLGAIGVMTWAGRRMLRQRPQTPDFDEAARRERRRTLLRRSIEVTPEGYGPPRST
jgi:hypothetical protein